LRLLVEIAVRQAPLQDSGERGENLVGMSRGSCESGSSRACPRVTFFNSSRSRILLAVLLVLSVILGYCAILAEPLGGEDPSADEGTARALAGIAPEIRSGPPEPFPATSGVEGNYSFWVRDADSTSLNLTWDWGDGIVETSDMTIVANVNTKIYGLHAYNPVPEQGRSNYNITYNFNLTIEDPEFNLDYDITVVSCLVNVTNGSPSGLALAINATAVDPSEDVYIMASAYDSEGEALTWVFTFNDLVQDYRVLVSHTPATAPGQRVWNNITHTFGTVGQHKVTMNVSDALVPYQQFPHNLSTKIDVEVSINTIPEVSDTIATDPSSLVVVASIGYGLMNYSIEAFDNDGDVLTVTWNFGDGTPEVVNVSAGGTATYFFVQTRNYTDGGIFNITVNVTDGRVGHETSLYRIVLVNSTNEPPSLVLASPLYWGNGSYGAPNQTVNFTLVLTDPEQDVISVTIDFGDGSPKLFVNLTEFVDGNATYLFQHIYAEVKDYEVLINYTDNKAYGRFNHYRNVSLMVKIYVPAPPIVVIWNWWDYTSLGLLAMIPVVAVVRWVIVGRRRKQLEREGMTLEEWKLISDEMGKQEMEKKY